MGCVCSFTERTGSVDDSWQFDERWIFFQRIGFLPKHEWNLLEPTDNILESSFGKAGMGTCRCVDMDVLIEKLGFQKNGKRLGHFG